MIASPSRLVSGVTYSAASQLIRQVTQLGTTVVLARFLEPSDFGLMGMALLATGFVALLKDLGTSAAVIQAKDVTTRLLSTLFWLNMIIGLLATVIVFAGAPLVIMLFDDQRVGPILQMLSLTFVISGVGVVQQAILERNLLFKILAKIEITATILGCGVGIASALLGYGVLSLVNQSLTIALTTTVLLWVWNPWRPALLLDWAELKCVGAYSLNLTGYNVFNYFARNADNFLIGRFLGAQDLGYYSLAYRFLLYPIQTISAVIGRVMFPFYSRIQDDFLRFRRHYLNVAASVALVTFPMMVGLMALAEPFVLAVLGPQWRPVIVLLQILAPIGLMQSIGSTVGAIYQAKGRTDWMLWWGVAAGSVVMLSFLIGLRWGITGVAAAYAVASAVLVYPSFAIPFRLISLRVCDLGTVLWRPLLSSGLMFLALVGLKAVLPADLTSGLILGVLVPWGIVTYLTFTWMINRDQLRAVLGIVGVGGCRVRN